MSSDQIESLFTFRSYQRSLDVVKARSINTSATLLNFMKISHSIYQDAFEQKVTQSPNKLNIQKFQELKKKIINRVYERSKRINIQPKRKTLIQSQQFSQSTAQVASTALSCSKMVLSCSKKPHTLCVKKPIKVNQEDTSINEKLQKSSLTFLKPVRRFSEQISSQKLGNRILVGRHIRMRGSNKTKNDVLFKSGDNFQEAKNCSRQILLQESSCKNSWMNQRKGSQRQQHLIKIQAWNSNFVDQQEVVF